MTDDKKPAYIQQSVHVRHDSYFKAVWGTPAKAADFIKHHLPAIADLIDLDSLQNEDGTQIEPDMKAYYADVIYRARLSSGRSGSISSGSMVKPVRNSSMLLATTAWCFSG